MTASTTAYLYPCPNCRQRLSSSRKLFGKRVRCLKCQNVFVVPEAAVKENPHEDRNRPVIAVPPVIADSGSARAIDARPNVPCSLPFISPSDLQVKGETAVLFGTLAVAASVFLFATLTTALIFGILVLIAYFGIKSHQSNLRRTAFRVTAQSAPEIDVLIQTAARRLTMPTPELFIVEDRAMNAFAIGIDG